MYYENIHLNYGKELKNETSPIIEEQDDEDTSPKLGLLLYKIQDMTVNQHLKKEPSPHPKRLILEKPLVQPEFDFLGVLRSVCVKIPLLQAIIDVPINVK